MPQPIHFLPPKLTITNIATELTHIVPTSNTVTLSFKLLKFPAQNNTPAHSVTRKIFPPAVFATKTPLCCRRPDMTETNFSGKVVAKERNVIPRTVPERWNVSAKVEMECDRT